MNAIVYDIATTRVLWRRDLARFWRQPSRVIGALGQPVLFWLVIGSGLARTFQIPGVDVGYMEYFFTDAVAVKGGVVFYQSGDKGRFRDVSANDRLFLELTYSF